MVEDRRGAAVFGPDVVATDQTSAVGGMTLDAPGSTTAENGAATPGTSRGVGAHPCEHGPRLTVGGERIRVDPCGERALVGVEPDRDRAPAVLAARGRGGPAIARAEQLPESGDCRVVTGHISYFPVGVAAGWRGGGGGGVCA